MYRINILIFVTLFFGSVICDLNVDQYNNIINNFIEKTQTYQYPTSSASFVNGTYDTKGCTNFGAYDFIIVGAGSSGTVLANRLSEIKNWNILVLEAGGEENEFSDIPAMFDYLRLSDFNWGYKSVPQKNSLFGYIDNTQIIPRGKVLGGSSTINAIMYVRGNHLDYDKWAEANNPGWSYQDLLPYFKKSEDAHIAQEDPGYHGHNGTLSVENVNDLTPLTQAFLSANQELGRKKLDYNGKEQIGESLLQLTATKGRRCSGAKAFLKPARSRSNLKILTNALVLQLLIYGKSVYGVKFMQGSKTYCAYSNKEVILSAGAINSPQLLMLAGIGPKDHLNSVGIDVIQDLPVGQNIWDHICFALQPFTTNLTLKDESQNDLIQQYLNGKGFLTSSDAVQDVAFQSLYWPDKMIPDIEHILRASKIPTLPYNFYKMTKNFGTDIYNNILKKIEGKVVWQSYSVLLNPKSRGCIKLKSKNPFDFPLIDPNYFSDPGNSDLNTMIASIKDMIKISNTKAMQKFNSQILKIDLPKCNQTKYFTDEYYGCLVKNLASTLHHYSGSCKMGPQSDKTAVVGSDLRVHNIMGLRVVDCSVIPVTISGHTNAVAFMIAEKAADMIKDYWLANLI